MILSWSAFALSAILVLVGEGLALPAKYDQRQEGELNVRTDVEDVVFVVVPPQDLVTAGMGLIAATAADLLRKNYGTAGPERWPLRTPPKLGFVPLEKSPYKIDLEKSGGHVKKVVPAGDPNRYNFHETKNPSKSSAEVKTSTTERIVEKTTTTKFMENVEEAESSTENKTVKKDLKQEEMKEVKEEMKEHKTKDSVPKVETITDSGLEVIGVQFDPSSISRLEGCGPQAYRDNTGKCVYLPTESTPK